MKFCPKRTVTFKGLNGVDTTSHFITEDDIKTFHGSEFFNQWLNFSNIIKKNFFDNTEGYYYEDYKFIAYRTELFLTAS